MKETDEDYENDLELNYYRYNLFEEVRRKYADAPIRQRVEAAVSFVNLGAELVFLLILILEKNVSNNAVS